jgi:crotonobetaine/carnitine-CoA ligase
VLDRHARERPDVVFVRFENGAEWSFAETKRQVRRTAAALQGLGVAQGDPVVAWLPNGPEALRLFLALGYIGAVWVPINTAYRGALLAHVLANAGARVIVADGRLIPRLAEIGPTVLETLVSTGPAAPDGSVPALRHVSLTDVEILAGEPRDPERPIRPWDTQSIIYTSGTTGPSKGVLSSYLHAFVSMDRRAWPCLRDDDRFLVNLPMFHIGGSFIAYSMLCRGGSMALVEGFRTEAFWDTVRATGATAVFLLGVMASFLMKRPPDPSRDRDHPLRMAFVVPLAEDGIGLAERFGVEVWTIFNMTEIATPLIAGPNPRSAGLCGRVRKGADVRLVDENDCEVPAGEVGELVLRADCPWTLSHGYNADPEATARTWRNGWFHTGDAFRRDAAGDFYFVDRLKDAIRRRGENISSFEVEAAVNAHPDVQESAAIPVPGEQGEDEVMVVVAPRPGRSVAPAALVEFLIPRMAHFMVPRYVRLVDALPKTPTAKIRKAALRADGRTPDTWDREAAGIVLRRERLG